MNYEIKKENWAAFFENLTKRRFEWMTDVEVIGTNLGDQTLSRGLPLSGITFEEGGDKTVIYVYLGETTDNHQTHKIENPVRVGYLEGSESAADVVDIEDVAGLKTLIRLIEPMGLLVGFSSYECEIATAQA